MKHKYRIYTEEDNYDVIKCEALELKKLVIKYFQKHKNKEIMEEFWVENENEQVILTEEDFD